MLVVVSLAFIASVSLIVGNMTVVSNQRGYALSRRNSATGVWGLFKKKEGFGIKKRTIVS